MAHFSLRGYFEPMYAVRKRTMIDYPRDTADRLVMIVNLLLATLE